MCYHVYDTLGDPCYLYLIECDGHYKIGMTTGIPTKRMSVLQSGSPHPMTLIAFFQGAALLERVLLAQFRHLRVRGEWFLKDLSILDEFIRRGQHDCEVCAA